MIESGHDLIFLNESILVRIHNKLSFQVNYLFFPAMNLWFRKHYSALNNYRHFCPLTGGSKHCHRGCLQHYSDESAAPECAVLGFN